MPDIILESIGASITGLILGYLWWIGRKEQLYRQLCWRYLTAGFALIFLGRVVDITDNFPTLNHYIIIGDTTYEAFLEKIVGSLFGSILLFIGFWHWFPLIAAFREAEQDLKRSHEKLETLGEERTAALEQAKGRLQLKVEEHKQAEVALRESEERFRAITEANPIPILISRVSDGMILYANAHLGLTFGLPTEEMLGRQTPDFYYDPADRQVLLDALARNGYLRNYEVRVRKADGTPFWVVVSLQAITFDGEPALLSGFYDITERKQAEEGQRKALAEALQATHALRESEAKNRAILDAIPDMMFRVSKDGTYLEFKAAKGLEPLVRPSEFLGKTVAEVMPPEMVQPFMHYLERTLQSGDTQIFEYQLSLQGDMRDYEARFVVCGVQGDEVLAIVRNITQRKAREALLEAERVRIARDLHDGLAQSLYLLGLKLNYRHEPGEPDTLPETAQTDLPLHEPIEAPGITPLTELELAILRLVAQGLSNSDIGDQLSLAEKTISNRLTVIFDKLHVNNRVQAALFALRQGLASLDEEDT